MKRMTWAFASVGLLAAGAAGDVAPPPQGVIQWGKPVVVVPASLPQKDLVSTQAEDGSKFTIAFTNLTVQHNPGGGTLTSVRVAAINVSVQVPKGKRLVGFHTDLRGSVHKSAGARVLVMAELGAAASVIEFPYGKSRGISQAGFTRTIPAKPLSQGDIAPVYTANLVLSVQRRTAKDDALLTVDLLDVVPVVQ